MAKLQAIKIQDFCRQLQDPEECRKSRLFIMSPLDTPVVRNAYQSKIETIRVSEHVTADGFIPMPSRVFSVIETLCDEIAEKGKIPWIIGLDGYLTLIKEEKVVEAFHFLKPFLDRSGKGAVVFCFAADWHEIGRVIKNPRYYEGQNIVLVKSNNPLMQPWGNEPVFINEDFADKIDNEVYSICNYLSSWEDGHSRNSRYVSVKFNDYPFPGVSENIKQIVTSKNFTKCLLNLDWQLSDGAAKWVLENFDTICDSRMSLKKYFFPKGNIDLRENVIKVFQKIQDKDKMEVFLSLIKHNTPAEYYLRYVVDDNNFSEESFVDIYVCKAIEFLDQAHAFACERSAALNEVQDYSTIIPAVKNFIEKTKDKQTSAVLPWLNIGLDIEKYEIMRRAMAAEHYELKRIMDVFPELAAYCDTKQGVCISENLDLYFNEYRQLKQRNTISEEFYYKARNSKIPDELERRDSLLNSYREDGNAFLLIVDALGAEYIPMIVNLARQRKLGIKDYCYAVPLLPTSTQFNKIDFPVERVLKLQGLDQIIHNGIHPHGEPSSDEENLTGELEYIAKEVMKEIDTKLKFFERVILTSDHGASRLAVLAYKQGLAKKIQEPPQSTVEDWRYARKNSAQSVIHSEEIKEDGRGEYVVVLGYDRFSHQGGAKFELHGGATLEEQLVPFIIFERGATYAPPVKETDKPGPQIEEDEDFDL